MVSAKPEVVRNMIGEKGNGDFCMENDESGWIRGRGWMVDKQDYMDSHHRLQNIFKIGHPNN